MKAFTYKFISREGKTFTITDSSYESAAKRVKYSDTLISITKP